MDLSLAIHINRTNFRDYPIAQFLVIYQLPKKMRQQLLNQTPHSLLHSPSHILGTSRNACSIRPHTLSSQQYMTHLANIKDADHKRVFNKYQVLG